MERPGEFHPGVKRAISVDVGMSADMLKRYESF